MIRYRLTTDGETVFVILDTTALEEAGRLQFEGSPTHVMTVRWLVQGATGRRAARLGAATTARDLRYAMTFDVMLAQCDPVLVDGQGLFDPGSG